MNNRRCPRCQSHFDPPARFCPRDGTPLVELIKNPPAGEEEFLRDLLSNRVPAGVDEAAYVKAGFLTAIATGATATAKPGPSRSAPRPEAK